MEIASAAAGEVTKSILSHLEREISYLVHFNRNIQNLRTKIEQLIATRDVVQRLIDAALRNNQVIREPAQIWLQKVETVREEATQLSDEAGLVNNWFKGWCCARLSLGRKADKKNLMIQALLDERNTFGDTVSDPKPIQSLEIVVGGDFDVFASRESTTKKILEALKDGEIGLIGVFGMAGVGKTMLLEAISKKVKKERMFNEVVMVTVSQNPNLETIQDKIANELDLVFGNRDNSFTTKAKSLYERINQGKKTLIVLDDLWERLEIAKIGIPQKNVNKDCKVVFTTRDRGVCGKMESDVSIEVTTLTAEDAWQLFRKKAGDVQHNSILPGVAKEIASECKGLPLAIATLGRALRDKDETIWNSALQLLRKSNFDGMSFVFSSIKMSYNFLPNEKMKMCFLFCCLYPEDYKIDTNNIFFHVMGEKLLRNADTFMEARSMFHLIVDELVSSCLLLKDKEGYVKLHDVVRDVAISIASEESNRFIVKAGMNLTEWPDVELGNCIRLSLMSNKITRFLPCPIQAPNLLTLCLNENSGIKEIPSDFFEGMQNLTTLDLSRTKIQSLPPSFSCLKSLRALCMDNCNSLVDISQVKWLERLEILTLREWVRPNPIEFHPQRDFDFIRSWECLGKLTTLKILDLSIEWTPAPKTLKESFLNIHDNTWERFLPKVILNLHRLEELRIIGYLRYDDKTDVRLSEIACLTRLTCLHMSLSTECNSYEVPSHWENLSEFMFMCHSRDFNNSMGKNSVDNIKFLLKQSREFNKSMLLQLPSISIPNWVPVLSSWTKCLFLVDCCHLESVEQLDPSGMFNNLKLLSINMCDSMMHLYNTTCMAKAPMYAFRSLERLQLNAVHQLVAIYEGTLPQGFFQNLKFLEVKWCSKVIILIPCDLLERLQNLEILKVEDLKYMEKLVQLEKSSGPSFPIFPKLRELHISGCFKLKYLFPMRVLRELKQLEILDISHTSMLMIVEHENYEDEGGNVDEDKVILPRLKSIGLDYNSELLNFCTPRMYFDWPALEYLSVRYSPRLKRLPLHTNSAPKLRLLLAHNHWFNRLEWEDESLKSRLQPLLTEEPGWEVVSAKKSEESEPEQSGWKVKSSKISEGSRQSGWKVISSKNSEQPEETQQSEDLEESQVEESEWEDESSESQFLPLPTVKQSVESDREHENPKSRLQPLPTVEQSLESDREHESPKSRLQPLSTVEQSVESKWEHESPKSQLQPLPTVEQSGWNDKSSKKSEESQQSEEIEESIKD